MDHRSIVRVLAGVAAAAWAALMTGCASGAAGSDSLADLAQEVFAAERAFAASMAERDHAAFTRHLAEDAVFFTNGEPLRGREAVAAGWQPFFEGREGPGVWRVVFDKGSPICPPRTER